MTRRKDNPPWACCSTTAISTVGVVDKLQIDDIDTHTNQGVDHQTLNHTAR